MLRKIIAPAGVMVIILDYYTGNESTVPSHICLENNNFWFYVCYGYQLECPRDSQRALQRSRYSVIHSGYTSHHTLYQSTLDSWSGHWLHTCSCRTHYINSIYISVLSLVLLLECKFFLLTLPVYWPLDCSLIHDCFLPALTIACFWT